MKNISFLSENFQFLEVKIKFSMYLNRRVFVMVNMLSEGDGCAENKYEVTKLFTL